ncbi:type I restriction endonuclease subunit R [Sarcina ventriculi]|uniref:type I restriction endonuclease subunit R n=1 Tax=Sarcina ventriculi TaxID=1267 RepID=UPI001C11F7C6|nr:DEAD/DEAH box helicase family protein [Sarcina ventriculi]MBU5323556.1 DEAD/DEAH box helicase family protein [Sarcina ventriculi]
MNEILNEKQYQHFIIDYLKTNNGYLVRKDKNFDRLYAMDREMLFKFLNDTQPNEMDVLSKIYKTDLEETLINYINTEMTKKRGNLLEVLKHGIEISNTHLDLMYTKPATDFNKELISKYEKNIFSIIEEVEASDKERIDLVIFLNGFAIMTFELKCNTKCQSYEDAIYQYRTDRNPKTRLFLFKAGALVNFAMDLEQVYMTTKLEGDSTFFLPFNMGNGEGVNAGAGNPLFEDKYSVSYMWEDILTKDSIIELISKFILLEIKEETDEVTGKKKIKENIIFPRFHQRDALRKVLDDVYENGLTQNYLIQHSAGSGKTNSIAWLAYRLSSLHDKNNKIIFDNIIVVTDRIVVDRQLQSAIMGMEHKSGLIKVMNDKCNSRDLAIALNGNTKIIATTIQKFPYIVDEVDNLKNKKFAVIIDEAHSSTAGKEMAAVTKTLGSGELQINESTAEDLIIDEVSKHGKQENVSMFAFTATPKPTTLQLFGRVNKKGQREAFHIYSMKQAIEEGFILDVLQNYTTYKTYYQINKEIVDDPKCKTNDAKRQIARFVELHETNISQRIEVIVEHFRTTVLNELGGKAKAMVITASREGAVKYRQAFENYIIKKGYDNIHALVAFSGKVTDKNDNKEYTEVGINGFSEDKLPTEFNKDEYKVLLVANKYQTGFDQPKLCAMYILKKLKGVNAVQTLSRLNRICPPYNKKTFILDFVNDYEDIESAFSKYYTTTLLSNSVTPTAIYDIEAKIDGYLLIDPIDIDDANDILYKNDINAKDNKKLTFLFQKTKKNIEKIDDNEQREFISILRRFVRFYEFLIQVSCFEDTELHKKYRFVSLLLAYINIKHPGGGYNLDGKINAINLVQKKNKEHLKSNLKSSPISKLPTAENFVLSQDKEKKLSEIIAEINSIAGKSYDNNVAVKAMLQIRDIMMKSDKLKTSAKNNTEKDFEFAYFDNIDDALIEGLEQNQDFFSLLLSNDEIKKMVLGIFSEEIYNSLKGAK